MNFRTALSVITVTVVAAAGLASPAVAQEPSSSVVAATSASPTASASANPSANPSVSPDPSESPSDDAGLSNNQDGSVKTKDGVIESVGSLNHDNMQVIGAIISVFAALAGFVAILGKTFPPMRDMIRQSMRGSHF